MKLIEVIGGLRGDPGLVAALTGFARRIGKHPVVAADTPGFVVNHAGRAYGPEALRIVAQGIATPREVDLLMKEAAGFRMGPFELLDLVGADVAHAVMVSIYERYFGDPLYQQKAAARAGGYRGCLGVPMVREGQVVDRRGEDVRDLLRDQLLGRRHADVHRLEEAAHRT